MIRRIKTYASLIIAIVFVILTLLPEDYNLPRFFLFVALALLVLRDIAEIRATLAEILLLNRESAKTNVKIEEVWIDPQERG